MRYLIIIVLSVAFLIPWCAEHVMGCNVLLAAGLHHFFHGNVFHLAANSLAVWYLFRKWNLTELFIAWLIASLSYFASPAIGASNIIYAVMGLRTPSLGSSWWRRPETVIFIIITLLMLLIPGVSGITHIISFVAGTLTASVVRFIRQTRNDGSRYI